MKKISLQILFSIILVAFAFNTLQAQTSSSLAGKVLDEQGNIPLVGVNVQITYLPCNKTISVVTNKKGFFCAGNLLAGGPYLVTFSYSGFEGQKREVETLDLNEMTNLSLHMRKDTSIPSITENVVPQSDQLSSTALKQTSL